MNIKLPKIETHTVNVDGQIMALAKCQFDVLRLERAKGNIKFLAVQDTAGDWQIVDNLGRCENYPYKVVENCMRELFYIKNPHLRKRK